MNVLEALRRCGDERSVLEARLASMREELQSLEASLTAEYGEGWEQRYQEAVAKLEAWELSANGNGGEGLV